MTTVINNPGDGNGAVGWLIGVVLVIIILFVFFAYALPAIRNSNAPADNGGAQINVQLPSGNNEGGGEEQAQ